MNSGYSYLGREQYSNYRRSEHGKVRKLQTSWLPGQMWWLIAIDRGYWKAGAGLRKILKKK